MWTSTFIFILGHGRLTHPAPRAPIWQSETNQGHTSETATYRLNEAPFTLNGPMTHNGQTYSASSFRCHDFAQKPPTQSIHAGQSLSVQWTFEANHPGDCSLYISYDESITSFGAQSSWYKLADFPGCADKSALTPLTAPPLTNEWTIQLPEELPQCDHCVLRWEWLAVQQVTNVEFYVSCSDIKVESVVQNIAEEIAHPRVWIDGIGHLPDTASSYRKAYDGEFGYEYLVGPAVAVWNVSVDTTPPAASPSRPTPIESYPPSPPAPPTTCIPKWGSCTNQDSSCCDASDTCIRQDIWYSQCRPDCPIGWECRNSVLVSCVETCLANHNEH